MVPLIRILTTCIGLLVLTSCDFLNESSTDSGVSGKEVAAGEIQTKIGRGSPSDWSITKCAVVEHRTEWRWNPPRPDAADGDEGDPDPYIFHIDKPDTADKREWSSQGLRGDVLITLLPLSSCAIDDSAKIAFTTKDWLCVDDYVKVNGTDCLIKAIREL